ncbi:MAG: cyclic nucleotide-binding domain-containing protein [Candidatus Lindowbacteria bacterium]|nr:cyclic nucleotide-binding domain-containing protein [Candidatus Lindowbacteria bacterium]
MTTFHLFEGLAKPQINQVIEAGVIRPLPKGKMVFHKGERGREMFLILKGKISVVDELGDHQSVMAELGTGEILGEMAIFEEEHTRSAHAIVNEPSQVLVLSEETIKELYANNKMPKRLLVNIITALCRRVRITNGMYMSAKYGIKQETPSNSGTPSGKVSPN